MSREIPNEGYFEAIEDAEWAAKPLDEIPAPTNTSETYFDPDGTHTGRFFSALERVSQTIGRCFPEIYTETIYALAVPATLLLEDQQNPVALNLEGPPSSAKTTLADFFDSQLAANKVYRSDKFTPKSFVSHASSVKREKLEEIDLLPRIKHKLFIVPELAPLFGLRAEDLLENFSILTRVLDGAGLTTDSGVQGQRGYQGDYLFAWLGCTTPIPHRVWDTMGKLGSRFLFLEMPDSTADDDSLVETVTGGDSYIERVQECQAGIADFLEGLWQEHGGARGVVWDRKGDPKNVMKAIVQYARVLIRLRGTTTVWREGSGDSETHNWRTPIIEHPHRAISLLYALARGHALIHGRTRLTADDLPIVARTALESAPNDRRKVMRVLLANGGTISSGDVEEAIRASRPTARTILETLSLLGVGAYVGGGPEEAASLYLADDLKWLLKENGRCVSEGAEKSLTSCDEGAEKNLPVYPQQPEIDLGAAPLDEIRERYEGAG